MNHSWTRHDELCPACQDADDITCAHCGLCQDCVASATCRAALTDDQRDIASAERVAQPLDPWFVDMTGWQRIIGGKASNEARVVVGATGPAEAAIRAFSVIAAQRCPLMGLDVRKLASKASKAFDGWRVDLVVAPARNPWAREHLVASVRKVPTSTWPEDAPETEA